MSRNRIAREVLNVLRKHEPHACSVSRIGAEGKFHGISAGKLRKTLEAMARHGEVVKAEGRGYMIGAGRRQAVGTISITPGGKGFVSTKEEGRDIFIPKGSLSTAMPGDLVRVRISTGRGKGSKAAVKDAQLPQRTGRVVEVLERRTGSLVGTLQRKGSTTYVIPLNRVYSRKVRVKEEGMAAAGDLVLVKLKQWTDARRDPEGEIAGRIGKSTEPGSDTKAVISEFGFRKEFPAEVMREADKACELLNAPGERLDCRGKYTLTIDPARAKDFDDALSLERKADGARVLGVHIADVAHFAVFGSAMDREARLRGNSVYLADTVIPMLPEQLSNNVCSLRPMEDRLAHSVFVTFDKNGEVTKADFARTIIKSRARLNYSEAVKVLEPGRYPGETALAKPTVSLLRDLWGLAGQLREKRFRRYALDLDMPEYEVVTDKDGAPVEIRRMENDSSHQLIEECMIAANEAVARRLSDSARPGVYRIHEPPSQERLEALGVELRSMGFNPPPLENRRNMARFLKSVCGKPTAHYVRTAVLKSLNRAVYSPESTEHFGLAKRYYTHFTSPIRRYPDLVVHRLLQSVVGRGGNRGYSDKVLGTIATSCSTSEQKADEAERVLKEIKVFRYLEAEAGSSRPKVHDAVVVGVTSFGIFVELLDVGAQGMVHMRKLGSGGRALRVGARVKAEVESVERDTRRLSCRLAR
ncbi:MAG: VacB/RNase II family 3'-5' exoribonuclease [Kiritimatiellia bacterium]